MDRNTKLDYFTNLSKLDVIVPLLKMRLQLWLKYDLLTKVVCTIKFELENTIPTASIGTFFKHTNYFWNFQYSIEIEIYVGGNAMEIYWKTIEFLLIEAISSNNALTKSHVREVTKVLTSSLITVFSQSIEQFLFLPQFLHLYIGIFFHY